MNRTIVVTAAFVVASITAAQARAANEEQIRRSIAAAVAYLKSQHGGDGGATSIDGDPKLYGAYEEGPAALAGIALIEAGVSIDDPVVRAITTRVRLAAVKQHKTYQLGLDIMFLDKIGDPVDTEIIQSLGIRLMAGQNARGGWTYNCPNVDAQEHDRLTKLVAGAGAPKNKEGPVGIDIDTRPRLSPENEDVFKNKRLVRTQGHVAGDATEMDDNSNTQFAVLGLWVARRHGVPAELSLTATENRFRSTQDPRGGWAYIVGGFPNPTPPMTCAGLLALAVGAGNSSERVLRAGKTKLKDDSKESKDSKEPPRPSKQFKPLEDRAIVAGLAFVAANMLPPREMPRPDQGGIAGPSLPGAPGSPFGGKDWIRDLYFLWSLERVCMVFGLKDIGGKDWYQWGATYLVATQQRDGSWRSEYTPQVDTCFGLMFMCRSNVIRDLSNIFSRKLRAGEKVPATPATPETKVGGSTNVPPPAPMVELDSTALAKAFLEAAGDKQKELLDKLMKEKGAVYTAAIAESIPRLSGDMQKRARDALAERIANFSTNTVKGYLRHDKSEMRRAAAIAVYMREDNELIPDLIATLNDREEIVWRAARLALKGMSGKDFGPLPNASDAEKAKAIADWNEWHKSRK